MKKRTHILIVCLTAALLPVIAQRSKMTEEQWKKLITPSKEEFEKAEQQNRDYQVTVKKTVSEESSVVISSPTKKEEQLPLSPTQGGGKEGGNPKDPRIENPKMVPAASIQPATKPEKPAEPVHEPSVPATPRVEGQKQDPVSTLPVEQSKEEPEPTPVSAPVEDHFSRMISPFKGEIRQLASDRKIVPFGLEVTFDKTVHLIFPSAVRYIDLGSPFLIAGKADGAENVVRIKASRRNFEKETNFSVITEEGNFYTFNVIYADEPAMLNIEMKDFLTEANPVNRPNNAMQIFMDDTGSDSPLLVRMLMNTIYDQDLKNISVKENALGIEFQLKALYVHNDNLYFHLQVANSSDISFDIDYINFKVVDRKLLKRTAMQEQVLTPLRVSNYATNIGGRLTGRMVFVLGKLTIPRDKHLVIQLVEKGGARHQKLVLTARDLLKAQSPSRIKQFGTSAERGSQGL